MKNKLSISKIIAFITLEIFFISNFPYAINLLAENKNKFNYTYSNKKIKNLNNDIDNKPNKIINNNNLLSFKNISKEKNNYKISAPQESKQKKTLIRSKKIKTILENNVIVKPEDEIIIKYKDIVLNIPKGAVKEDTEIIIEELKKINELNPGMQNVTDKVEGYRFLPDGMKFEKHIEITLPYSKDKIKNKEDYNNLYTYFYNEQIHKWEKLERISLDIENGLITSKTNHFTDLINSVLKLPESPDPLNFNVNSIKDIKTADPMANIPDINGLDVNSQGDASFSIPFNIPKGRNGVNPDIALVYNSSIGNGWLGRGFNINIFSINIDTKFGLPKYDGNDTYLLNGLEIVPVGQNNGNVHYKLMTNNTFDRIVRTGTNGNNYTFNVTSKDGTNYYYGYDDAKLTCSKGVYIWYIKRIVDKNGNTIVYNYTTSDGYTYLSSIIYTGHTSGEQGKYRIEFINEERNDIKIDCRGKFISKMENRLKDIIIYNDNTVVRKYNLEYKYNEFGQSHIIKFRELDNNDNEFYAYDFRYNTLDFDADNDQYEGFQDTIPWENAEQTITKSQTITGGGGAYVGVGFDFQASIGVNAGISFDYSNDLLSFIDINGDSLPDQVGYLSSGGPFYARLNTGSGFLDPILIPGFNKSLNESIQTGFNFGVSGSIGPVGASGSGTISFSDSLSTILDFNSDGFLDIIPSKNSTSYLKGNGENGFTDTDFTATSSTPNIPEIGTGINNINNMNSLKSAYYLLDPVRKWQPYHSGRIKISGVIEKLDNGTEKSDGVKINLYRNNSSIWDNITNQGNWDQISENEQNRSILLKEGIATNYSHEDIIDDLNLNDKIYFKVSSINDVKNDLVNWDPEIIYLNIYPHEFMSFYDCAYIKNSYEDTEFNGLLSTINNSSDKIFTRNCYTLITQTSPYSSHYDIKTALSENELNRLKKIFINAGYYLPKRIDADSFETNFINNFTMNNAYIKGKYKNYYSLNNTLTDTEKEQVFNILKNTSYENSWIYYKYNNKNLTVNKQNSRYYVNVSHNKNNLGNIIDLYQNDENTLGINTDKGVLVEIYKKEDNTTVRKWIKEKNNRVYLLIDDGINTIEKIANQDEGITSSKHDEILSVKEQYDNYEKIYELSYHDSLPDSINTEIYLNLYDEDVDDPVEPAFFENTILNFADNINDKIFIEGCYNTVTDESGDIINYQIKDDLNITDKNKLYNIYFDNEYLISYYHNEGNYYDKNLDLSTDAIISIKNLIARENLTAYKDIYKQIKVFSNGYYDVTETNVSSNINEETVVNKNYENTNNLNKSSYILMQDFNSQGNTIDFKNYIHVFKASLDFNLNDLCNKLENQQSGSGNGSDPPTQEEIEQAANNAYDQMSNGNIEPFSGGVYNWFYGEWNGNLDWDESKIGKKDFNSNNEYFITMNPQNQNTENNYWNKNVWRGTETSYLERGFDSNNQKYEIEKHFVSYISYDEICPSKIGGTAQDNIPGNNTAITLDGINSIRESTNTSLNGGAGVGVASVNTSGGSSISTKDIFDINGDSYPDQIIFPIGSCELNAILNKDGKGFDNIINIKNLHPNLRQSENSAFGIGITPGSAGSFIKFIQNPSGYIKGTIPDKSSHSFGCSFNGSLGESITKTDFIDINGDGLVDHVYRDGDNFQVKLNCGDEFIDAEWMTSGWGEKAVETSKLSGDPDNIRYTTTVSGGFSVSGGSASTGVNAGINVNGSRTKADLIDMNGDGLPDQVFKISSNDYFIIRFNLGDKFGDPVKWNAPSWKLNSSDSFSINNYVGNIINNIITEIVDKNGTKNGASVPTINFNGLNNFLGESANDINILGAGDVLTYSGGINFSIGFNFQITIPIFIVSLIIDPSGNFAYGQSCAQLQFNDINGDGVPDHIFKYDLDDFFRVKLNKAKSIGLLSEINTPAGGKYELEYEKTNNTINMPNSKYVLSKIIKSDGFGNSYPVSYQYYNGYYDREKRDFYGFDEVRIIFANDSYIVKKYYNTSYYNKGILYKSETKDELDRTYKMEESIYDFDIIDSNGVKDVVFPKIIEANQYYYDITTNESIKHTVTFEYDDYGNIIKSVDKGDTQDDDFIINIDYDYDENNYIMTNPNLLYITDINSKLLKRKTGLYDNNGNLTGITQYLADGNDPVYSFEYDKYGNITKTTDPNNYKIQYKYDDYVNTYITEIEDSFGYISNAEYDYNFGAELKLTDINGSSITREYDDFGRLVKVFTDYDNIIPAVEFIYQHNVFPSRAITKNKIHFDGNNQDAIDTIIILDGLRRIAQTKKEAEVLINENGTPSYGMIINGRIEYDELGRIHKEGQPVFEAGYNTEYTEIEIKNPNTIEYDILDRTVKNIMPDNSEIAFDYIIQNGEFQSNITDQEGNITKTYKDIRNYIVRKEQFNNNRTITTQYQYSLLGEINKIFDTSGNETSISYDTLGRITQLNNPDLGLIEYFYDGCSNLVKKIDNNLRNNGSAIIYNYEYNRIKSIDYPDKTGKIVYEYGANGDPLNCAGRIKQITDESGITVFEYGLLGENMSIHKTLTRLTPAVTPISFTTAYKYNYLGQIENITYPDGEILNYEYDQGGKIKRAYGNLLGETFEYVKNIYYDEFNQRKYIRYGNDVETTYTYDPYRRLLANILTKNSGNKVFQNIDYGFDKVGNIISIHNKNLVKETLQEYDYDDIYQLTNAQGTYYDNTISGFRKTNEYTQTFQYDDIGNINSKISVNIKNPGNNMPNNLNYSLDYEYNENHPHRVNRIKDVEYIYDDNGNLIERNSINSNTANQQNTQTSPIDLGPDSGFSGEAFGLEDDDEEITQLADKFKWDEDNRLTEATVNGLTSKYLYDAGGNRTAKYSELSETLYIDKMFQIQSDENPMLIIKHIFIGDTRLVSKLSHKDQGLNDINFQKQNTYYYHADHLGSSNYITDNDGMEYEHIEYTPYGELWFEEESDQLDRITYKFTGKELDEETNLYYYGARYLDSFSARWLSVDPEFLNYIPIPGNSKDAAEHNKNLPGLGGVYNPINLNIYAYSSNSPIVYKDPDGKCLNIIIGAAIGAAVGLTVGIIKEVQSGNGLSWEGVGRVALNTAVGAGAGALTACTGPLAGAIITQVGASGVGAIAIGAGTGAVLGAVAGGFKNAVEQYLWEGVIDWGKVGNKALEGAIWGAISGSLDQTLKNLRNLDSGALKYLRGLEKYEANNALEKLYNHGVLELRPGALKEAREAFVLYFQAGNLVEAAKELNKYFGYLRKVEKIIKTATK